MHQSANLLHVGVLGPDPLLCAALAGALERAGAHEGRGLEATAMAEPEPEVDVFLLDLGITPDGELAPFPPAPPTLVLVPDATWAARVRAAGALGALPRDTAPAALPVALAAAAAGFVVLAPAFAVQADPPPPLPVQTPLSPREQEVLELLAEGLSNKEIGRRLFVSANTVRFHVAAILDKLGASSRTEAVVVGARAGWLEL